eukprot:6186383-Pleurochrysis_carterae.AAC.8
MPMFAECAYLLGFIGEPSRCRGRFVPRLVRQEALSHLLVVELLHDSTRLLARAGRQHPSHVRDDLRRQEALARYQSRGAGCTGCCTGCCSFIAAPSSLTATMGSAREASQLVGADRAVAADGSAEPKVELAELMKLDGSDELTDMRPFSLSSRSAFENVRQTC